MTTEPQRDRTIASFETLARPSRFITIDGAAYELAHDDQFSVNEHGRMERLRRRVEAAWYGSDGSEISEELATVASENLRELVALLVPSAVGKTTMRTAEPTEENPNPIPVQWLVLDTLTDYQRVAIMELFTEPSQRASAIDVLLQAMGAIPTDAAPIGATSQPVSTAPTASPPVAAVTG